MKFKRDWSWVFSANSLFRVKIIIICKYSLKKAWEKLNIESGEWKLSLQEKNISDSAWQRQQNYKMSDYYFLIRKACHDQSHFETYLVFTVSLPQPQYWGRSLSYQISNTAASSRSRHHHNHFQYGESVKSGAVEIPHDTCRCRCRKHWTTWVLKTERMIYLQIRLELQLYTLALMGYTFYLSSVKTWFYTASHSSAWIWLDDCSVYKFWTEEEAVEEEFWWESWRILSP